MKVNKESKLINFEDQNLKKHLLLINRKWIIMNGKYLICIVL